MENPVLDDPIDSSGTRSDSVTSGGAPEDSDDGRSSSIWKKVSQQDLTRRIAKLVASRRHPAEHYLHSLPNDAQTSHRPTTALGVGSLKPSRARDVDDTQSLRSFHYIPSKNRARLSAPAGQYSRDLDFAVDSDQRWDTDISIDSMAPSAIAQTLWNSPIGDHNVKRATIDFSPRGIHIPSRTSSKAVKAHNRVVSPSRRARDHSPSVASAGGRTVTSSAASMLTYESPTSSVEPSALYDKGPSEAHTKLQPLGEDDPQSFDLLAPDEHVTGQKYSLEDRSELLFSKEHLQAIFQDSHQLHRFTSFLSSTRPKSIPLLIYYLDALKALRAINYANAVAEALDPIEAHDFTEHAARPTINAVLEEKAAAAFDVLVREDLPAFVTQVYIKVASRAIVRRVTGNVPEDVQEAEGLAEVFCFTDVSRPDNPIIFASEEFHRTTQYGVNYAIGRNCRFLQGPRTNRNSVRRIREAVKSGQELSEVFLNYRRDGSPFMNMLMMAPLYDSRGNLRYFIGAQIDISGLVKDCVDLEALQKLVAREDGMVQEEETQKDEFQELAEMFNDAELDSVRKHGGRMHREEDVESDNESRQGIGRGKRPRMHLRDSGDDPAKHKHSIPETINGRLEGVYQNYLLVRPAPSLRILFTSPSLRIPGILQSRFLDRIGGSTRVRSSLAAALAEGQGVTAKVKWLTNPRNSDEEGRIRWIHATPLLDANGRVGVWMILLVDEETEIRVPRGKFRPAPPVEPNFVPYQPEQSQKPQQGSIRFLPQSQGSSVADGYPGEADDVEDDPAPAPRIRNVQRNTSHVVSQQSTASRQTHSNSIYPNGINRNGAPRPHVTPGDERPDPLREHPPQPQFSPPPPPQDHVRITSPTSSQPPTPKTQRDQRSMLELGMSQAAPGMPRKGYGSADSVAL